MSEVIRSFTKEGNERFLSFIRSLKSNPTMDPPFEMLTDDSITNSIPKAPTIAREGISTKRQLAERIHNAIADTGAEMLSRDELEGMWNWLSLFFFDLITNERKNFGEEHRFVLSRNWNRRSRHLVESSYNAFRLHGEYASVILENEPWTGGEVFNNLAGTQEYWMNKSLFRAVHSLYWDDVKKRPKPGITPKEKPGTIRRLISLLNQLNRTYDLFALTHTEFRVLLPREFERWSDLEHESN